MLFNRKALRLPYYNYNKSGLYFITICTKNRRALLSELSVGTSVLDCPKNELLYYGKVSEKYIVQLDNFYEDISVSRYVIMPNHIHLVLCVSAEENQLYCQEELKKVNNINSAVSKWVSTFKRFCNKEYGENIWQGRFFDRVIRNENEYRKICEYIDNNPAKWLEDRFHPINLGRNIIKDEWENG